MVYLGRDPVGIVTQTGSGNVDPELESRVDALEDDVLEINSALDDKYEKPVSGIPASDLASGVIPDDAGDILIDSTAQTPVSVQDELGNINRALNNKANTSMIAEEYDSTATYAVGDYCIHDGVLYKCNTAISTAEAWTAAHWTATAVMLETGSGGGVSDVQVNGTSVVQGGVANVPMATSSELGVIKVGIGLASNSSGTVFLNPAIASVLKGGTVGSNALVPSTQHIAAFYGLAKAAGADMANLTGGTVGVYPEAQKSAISQMLDAPEIISGTTPSIPAKAGIMYVCGECSTLSITLPSFGCIDVLFNSGSTATVLTVTPPTGWAMKWANSFDPTSLESNTTYEVNILMKPDTNECIGVVGSWT